MEYRREYIKLWVSYDSYFSAYSEEEVGRLVKAMISYKLTGVEPQFSGSERFIWPAIRRDIDEGTAAQEARAETARENGKLGGRPKRTPDQEAGAEPAKTQETGEGRLDNAQTQGTGGERPDNSKTQETDKNPVGFFKTQKTTRTEDKDKDMDMDKDMDKAMAMDEDEDRDKGKSPLSREESIVVVVQERLGMISAQAGAELRTFEAEMGRAVCLRALDQAREVGKSNWRYVRGILRRKRDQGVKSLEDWDRVERNFDRTPAIAGTPRDVQPTPDRIQQNSRWLEEFLSKQDGGASA